MEQFLSNPSLEGLPLFVTDDVHAENSAVVNTAMNAAADAGDQSNGMDLFTLIFDEGRPATSPLAISSDAAVIDLENFVDGLPLGLTEQSTTAPPLPPFSAGSSPVSSPVSSPLFELPSPPASHYYDNLVPTPTSSTFTPTPDPPHVGEFNTITTSTSSEEPEGEGAKKKQKKRRRYELKGDTAVSLSRDQLLALSSKDLEEYIETVSKQRSLSAEELRELRRQRRIIKNREYAQQSRKKKKNQYEELEGTIDQLTQENEELRRENQELRNQIASLRSFYKIPDSPIPTNTGPTHLSHTAFIKDVKHPIGIKSIGACLLIMVFSFALVFNPRSLSTDDPFGGGGLRHSPYNRVLLNVEEESWWRALLNRVIEGASSVTITTTTITATKGTTTEEQRHSSETAPSQLETRESSREAEGDSKRHSKCDEVEGLTEEERARCVEEEQKELRRLEAEALLRTLPDSSNDVIQAA